MAIMSGIACKPEVPGLIKSAFDQQYPDAMAVDWEKELEGEWEAEFEKSGIEYTANYDAKGNWLETERPLPMAELPTNALQVLETEYAAYTITEVEYSETPIGSFYKVEVTNKNGKLDMVFSMQGDLMETSTGEDDEDDDIPDENDDDRDDDGDDQSDVDDSELVSVHDQERVISFNKSITENNLYCRALITNAHPMAFSIIHFSRYISVRTIIHSHRSIHANLSAELTENSIQ